MADCVDVEDENIVAEADDIATKITQFLIQGFKTKTGREPDNAEIEQLFEELTPERIAEMLGEEIPAELEGIDGEDPSEDELNEEDDTAEAALDNIDVNDEDVVLDAAEKVLEEKNIENAVDKTEIDKNCNNKRALSSGDCAVIERDSKDAAVDKHVRLE